MSYYKIISHLGGRNYEVEGLYGGAKRKMQIRYANIVRINEFECQVAERASLPYCTLASPSLIFAEIKQGEPLLPIEEAMCVLNDIKDLKVGSIIETNIDDLPFKELYRVESIPKEVNNVKTTIHDYTLCELNSSQRHTIKDEDLKNLSIKTLREDWKCVEQGSLVLKNSSGSYYRYGDASYPINYNTTLGSGQIIYIRSQRDIKLKEVAFQLGTKYQEVINVIKNVLPNGKNDGVGIDLYKRKQNKEISEIEDVSIDNVEFYRLLQYLMREDAQCKSIVRWKYHTNKKYPNITPAKYLDYSNNPHKELIPHSHLDMETFKDLVDWLLNKDDFATYKDEYFSFFHLLHWSEQISFIKKIITLHRNGKQQIQDIARLKELVQYPQYININVLIFVNALLKLQQKSDLPSNFELYSIWKSHLPQKIKTTFGLTLQDYVGTNLFYTCKGAIGFSEESWWLPHVYDYNKPVFHIFKNGRIDVNKRGYGKDDKEKNEEIKPTMEAARDCRAFVLFRDDDNYTAHKCFADREQESSIIRAIQKCTSVKEKIQECGKSCSDREMYVKCFSATLLPMLQKDDTPEEDKRQIRAKLQQLSQEGWDVNSIKKDDIGCPVLTAIEHDDKYRDAIMTKMVDAISKEDLEKERVDKIQSGDKREERVEISFNTCPLISVPGWRQKWAQKFKDKCTNNNPPQVNKYRLWYNRNASIKYPFFCEGQEVGKPHKEAGLWYNWCGGNSCFTDIYVSPFVSPQNNGNNEWQVNIYTAAIVLRLIADNNHENKRLFQYFHSRLNWLNSAASHFYCASCGYILEASKNQSKYNAHTITMFECQNEACENKGEIYINHCWNSGCRSIIDSRETSLCPNKKYICPSCGVCCGEGMFKKKQSAGLHVPKGPLHFELGKFYCYKCGALMTKQGNTYYCKHHPEVTTTSKAKSKKRYDKKVKFLLLSLAMVLGGYGVTQVNAQATKAKPVSPTFKTVTAEVGDTTVCYARCKHLIISDGKSNEVLEKINRHNYELVFEQYADSEKIDIVGALGRMFRGNFENELKIAPEDLIGKPLFMWIEQSAKTVYGGKILRIVTENTLYLGGSHEFFHNEIHQYNLATGELIDLSYLHQGEWVNKLDKAIYDHLPDFTRPHKDNPNNLTEYAEIMITDGGLLFQYKPYEVASFADGFVEVELTNEELSSLGVPLIWIE